MLAKEKILNTLPKKEVTVIASPSLVKQKTSGFALVLQLRFTTQFGQNIYVMGNHPLLGDNNIENAVPLTYFNENYWKLSLSFSSSWQAASSLLPGILRVLLLVVFQAKAGQWPARA